MTSILSKSHFLAILLFGMLSAHAENWTRFRGPNGQGYSLEQDLPVKWTKKDYLWIVRLPGMGCSSPVIWKEKVFVSCATRDNSKAWLIVFNASNSKKLWQKQYQFIPVKMHSLNSLAASTPVVDEKHVYALWYGKDKTVLVALDHKGKEIWTRDFGVSYLSHGPCSSPILYKDLIIFKQEQNSKSKQPESKWFAVHTQTGQIRWSLKRDFTNQASYSLPCVYKDKQGKELLIFSSSQHGISAVNPGTGKVAWEVKDVLPDRVVSSPVLAGDLIINTCGFGGGGKQLSAICPPAAPGDKPTITYTSQGMYVPYVSTGISVDKFLFLYHDQGKVTCLNSETGHVIWSEKPAGRYYSSPVYANGNLYCMDRDGKVVVLKAKDAYELLGIMDLGEKTSASVSIANGRIFLRTSTQLFCVGRMK